MNDNITETKTPSGIKAVCTVCNKKIAVPNKGVGKAKLATWRTRHQHLDQVSS